MQSGSRLLHLIVVVLAMLGVLLAPAPSPAGNGWSGADHAVAAASAHCDHAPDAAADAAPDANPCTHDGESAVSGHCAGGPCGLCAALPTASTPAPEALLARRVHVQGPADPVGRTDVPETPPPIG